MLGMGLWAIAERQSRRLRWSVLLVWGAAVGSNLILAWAYKDPDYVLVSALAGGLAFAAVLIAMVIDDAANAPHPASGSGRITVRTASLLVLAVSVAMLLGQLGAASNVNTGKQVAYDGMLQDLERLRSEGNIATDALIIAPAHGLPFEWSNPFVLSRPAVSYFDTGWLTFSPTYNRVLRDFGIDSLPQALYEKNNTYLMCEETFTPFLARYYEEHLGITVSFQTIYAVPNPNHLAGYDGNYLYKVSLAP